MKAEQIEEMVKKESPVTFVSGRTILDACTIFGCDIFDTSEGMPIRSNGFYVVTMKAVYEVE